MDPDEPLSPLTKAMNRLLASVNRSDDAKCPTCGIPATLMHTGKDNQPGLYGTFCGFPCTCPRPVDPPDPDSIPDYPPSQLSMPLPPDVPDSVPDPVTDSDPEDFL